MSRTTPIVTFLKVGITNAETFEFYLQAQNDAGWGEFGTVQVISSLCGDGIKSTSEACDNSNTDSLDGCSDTCTLECGFACDANEPQICANECGDGIFAAGERSDHGNTASHDGRL